MLSKMTNAEQEARRCDGTEAAIEGTGGPATVQKSDKKPEDVIFCCAALSGNSNEMG